MVEGKVREHIGIEPNCFSSLIVTKGWGWCLRRIGLNVFGLSSSANGPGDFSPNSRCGLKAWNPGSSEEKFFQSGSGTASGNPSRSQSVGGEHDKNVGWERRNEGRLEVPVGTRRNKGKLRPAAVCGKAQGPGTMCHHWRATKRLGTIKTDWRRRSADLEGGEILPNTWISWMSRGGSEIETQHRAKRRQWRPTFWAKEKIRLLEAVGA